MTALDRINATWGRETLFMAVVGTGVTWSMRQIYRSPMSMTVSDEIHFIKAT